ncbi:MAG: hypothetical protein ACOYON_02870 [Fimbriimonas sp.]
MNEIPLSLPELLVTILVVSIAIVWIVVAFFRHFRKWGTNDKATRESAPIPDKKGYVAEHPPEA